MTCTIVHLFAGNEWLPANFVLDSECTNKSVSLSSPLQKSVFCTIDRNSMYLVNVHFLRFWYFLKIKYYVSYQYILKNIYILSNRHSSFWCSPSV